MSRRDLTCEKVGELLALWGEGRLDAAETSSVDAHLASCPSCRDDAAAGRIVYRVLRDHASALREAAPASLRAAVGREVPTAPLQARRLASRWVPLAAAAALLVAIVGAGAFWEKGSVFAAQLALDHLKCMVLNQSHYAGDAAQLEREWQDAQGWHVDIPSGAPAGLRLTALRRCVASSGQMAHVMYERDARTLSLFIVRDAARGSGDLEIMGFGTATRTRGDRTYALVADLPRADASALLDRLLAELR